MLLKIVCDKKVVAQTGDIMNNYELTYCVPKNTATWRGGNGPHLKHEFSELNDKRAKKLVERFLKEDPNRIFISFVKVFNLWL